MGGYIMQLQNFSVNDGDGIRTVIFLAGCPLRCAWCANPEGQTLQNPMTRWAETEEILAEVRRQEIFYQASGGGVTFSGGEATAQPDFLAELTDALYDEGVSLAIETCGWFDFDRLAPVLAKMDRIFMDLKLLDPVRHRRYTGADNRLILENLARTARLGIPMTVRIPVILGVNGSKETWRRRSVSAPALPRRHAGTAALPRYGRGQYRRLGLALPDAAFGTPTPCQLERWRQMAGRPD